MSPLAQLDQYLDAIRARLRRVHFARGALVLAIALLALTLLAALLPLRWTLAPGVALGLRIAMGLCAAGAALFTWWHLRPLRAADGAAALEAALPEQGGRVDTYLQERRRAEQGAASPLLGLLAEDSRRVADGHPVEQALPTKRWALPAGAAAAALAVLAGLVLFGAGRWGDSARQLWLGQVPQSMRAAAESGGIAVKPGDVSVRRNQDLPISAAVAGGGGAVQVHVRFGADGEWEAAPMEPDGAGGYRFTLFAVREAAQYYVSAGRLKSSQHRINVVDLPRVESLRLTYDYPKWTGLPKRDEEAGGDIRAVAGTRVAVEVVTDTVMEGPLLVVNGEEDGLSQRGTTARGDLTVKEPGHYRIATKFGEEIVALTEDFRIDVVPDEKPRVEILRPGRDYQATNIEEVPVSISAQDDFRLEALELHYSVNGGDWRIEKLDAGAPDIKAAALLRLEEMQQPGPAGQSPLLVPGDLVSYYAMAKDHKASSQTDLFLIQVQPFDRRFSQGQGGGGGGGGGGGEDEGAISQRQREVLLATWNLQRQEDSRDQREVERRADSARMLAEVQKTLAEQATTLVERAHARLLTGADENIRSFVESLEQAAKEMKPAAEKLSQLSLKDAVTHEQRALQHLLRAESTFRDIQVAMQRGGGGGGGGQAGRDVSEMTELELDLEKNQYETEPQMTAQQQGEAESEALRRLRELARRQEQLAREAQRNPQALEAQRWQQEQLRREAEELRRQLEQLAQNRSGQQSGQQSNSQSGQQSGQSSGQPGSRSAQGEATEDAARQVADAVRQMQEGGPEQARRASEQLNRAREQLERGQREAVGDQFGNLAESARQLAERQRRAEDTLRAALGPRPPAGIADPRASQRQGLGFEQAERLAAEKRRIQQDLEALQRQMQTARSQSRERAPRASERVGAASAELDEYGTAARLARAAAEIERGRGVQAATRDGLITESLRSLQQGLEEARSLASSESAGQRNETPAEASELLAELGELRRALERARQQAAQEGSGQPGQTGEAGQSQEGDGRQASAGQQGQQGQQGQPGQQAGGQQGGASQSGGQQGGAQQGGDAQGTELVAQEGARLGERTGDVTAGNGLWGGNERLRGVPRAFPDRGALQPQVRMSSERLAQLREQLRPGTLNDTDTAALRELADRLRRAGNDPMAAEYQRMATLLNQLELAALRAEQATANARGARPVDRDDDSSRYRDNVAEYYRRLGGGQ